MDFRALRILLVVAAVFAAVIDGCYRQGESQEPQVTIGSANWKVVIADTSSQRYQGLSGRAALADDRGMLFIYPRPAVLRFVMRNCSIPLDIAFIDSSRRVTRIYTMEVEPDLAGREVYTSGTEAQYALEVVAGALGRAGVQVGDYVKFSKSIPPATKAEEGP